MISPESSRDLFAAQRYVVLPSLVDEPLRRFLWRYVVDGLESRRFSIEDSQVRGAARAYGDVVMEHLLDRLRPRIERDTGLALDPTYSYLRVYREGHRLERHRDRPACEISVSLTIGQQSGDPWPLWIEGVNGPRPVTLTPGDGVVYRGIDCDHWREPFAGDLLAQVFLHYVDRTGPHAAWRFDKRPSLSLTPPLPI